MSNIFNSVMFPKVGSNAFDLTHDVKLSFKMGHLVPSMVMEVIPGDVIRLASEQLLRFAPLLAPVMHRVHVTNHFFFVPNRILWPNWEEWITGNLEVEPPYVPVNNIEVRTLGDYLGLPLIPFNEGNDDEHVNALPVAAYFKIYDEYYRDQNLQDELFIPLTNGENSVYKSKLQSSPLRRAWQHDYFTSALPFAQKGAAVQIPLFDSGEFPVEYVGGYQGMFRSSETGEPITSLGNVFNLSGGTPVVQTGTDTPANWDPNGSLAVDINGDVADINSLRRAFRLQEWLEKNARGGTRYIENILVHFGVKSSDARLQRPEYIGGSKGQMVISEVLSTAETAVPVGNMAGHGVAAMGGREFKYRAEEHGFIIGIINVQPLTAYHQGLHKMWSRFDRLDYFWPSFAHIGEQEVKNKEVYHDFSDGENEDTFGYVPRYAEYKFLQNRVAGDFRDTLKFWHLGREFGNRPHLNEEFISCQPSNRIFAVEEGQEDHIYGHVLNKLMAIRKMPKYGIPSF